MSGRQQRKQIGFGDDREVSASRTGSTNVGLLDDFDSGTALVVEEGSWETTVEFSPTSGFALEQQVLVTHVDAAALGLEMAFEHPKTKLKRTPPSESEVIAAQGTYFALLVGLQITVACIFMYLYPLDCWAMTSFETSNGWVVAINWLLTASIQQPLYLGASHWAAVVGSFLIAGVATGVLHGRTARTAIRKTNWMYSVVLTLWIAILLFSSVGQGMDLVDAALSGLGATNSDADWIAANVNIQGYDNMSGGKILNFLVIALLCPIITILLFFVTMVLVMPFMYIGRLFNRNREVLITRGVSSNDENSRMLSAEEVQS